MSSIIEATEANFKQAKQLQRNKKFTGKRKRSGKKRSKLQILDGVLARPFHSLENSFELILRTWIPPPAKIIDPTAGQRWMWRNLLEPSTRLDQVDSGYTIIFGDIAPQVDDVIKLDARNAYRPEWFEFFDGEVVDPPYRRNVTGGRYDIEKFRGDPNFDLEDFFSRLNRDADMILKPTGKLIVKVGDARIGDNFEPWDMKATQLLTKFELKDRIVRRPFYQRKGAPFKRNDRAILTHEWFLLYVKRPKEDL